MSLIINGIDFDKRCDDAKRNLFVYIRLRAQLYGCGPYFRIECESHIPPQAIELQENIENLIKCGFSPTSEPIQFLKGQIDILFQKSPYSPVIRLIEI